ncbi:MAG: hypothetical protein ACFCVD_16215 [Nodosilinea sp.]
MLDAKVIEAPDTEAVEQHLCLDRGYDYEDCRQAALERGYIPHIPDKDAPVPPRATLIVIRLVDGWLK